MLDRKELEVKRSIKLEEEPFRAWLACGTSAEAHKYCQAKWNVAQAFAEQELRYGRTSVGPWKKTLVCLEAILANHWKTL